MTSDSTPDRAASPPPAASAPDPRDEATATGSPLPAVDRVRPLLPPIPWPWFGPDGEEGDGTDGEKSTDLVDYPRRDLAFEHRATTFPIARKGVLCAGCRERLCCYEFSVEASVRDVGEIATALALTPEVFLAYQRTEPSPRAFRLGPEGPTYRLVLERHPWLYRGYTGQGVLAATPADRPKGCCFLVRLPNSHHYCGLGSLRPAICRLFPVSQREQLLDVYEGPGCVRTWTLTEVNYAEEARLAQEFAQRQAEHERFLADWHREVDRLAAEEAYNFNHFCDSLLNWYARHCLVTRPEHCHG